MWRNHLRSSLRHFWHNKFFSLINLSGLSIGLAAALLIILYVLDELSYEKHHQQAEQIVRIEVEASFEGSTMKLAKAPNRAAPFLKEQLPEVKEAVRVFPHNFGESASITVGNQNFVETKLFWADSNLFKVFTLPLQQGDPNTVLRGNNKVILSARAAARYFGTQNPVGQVLKIDNRYDMEVTGVFEDVPSNTHLDFEMIGAFPTIPLGQPRRLSWGNSSFLTFLLLHQGVDPASLETKISAAAQTHIPEDRLWFDFKVKPLLDVHLYSKGVEDDTAAYGNISQIWVLSALAAILLLIACINYMNLATAKSEQRSKAVAINKTLGATGRQMASQFFLETGLLVAIGLGLSLLFIFLVIPYFNEMTGKDLRFAHLFRPGLLLSLLGGWGVITLIAGAYPAVFLSSFTPNHILRGKNREGKGVISLRKGLVVFQFAVSVVLMICTMILYQQLNYIGDKQLGFDPEQVVAVRVLGIRPASNILSLEKELQQLSTVVSTSLSQTYPGHGASGRSISKPNDPEGRGADLTTCRAHPGVIDVLDLNLIAGRTLKVLEEEDTLTQIILNESAIEYLGWTPEEAIGRRVEADLGPTTVVGVVEDFHFASLHQEIGLYGFHNRQSEWLQYLLLRLRTTDLREAMQQIENVFEKVAPSTALEYVFLDDSLDKLYKSEERLAGVVFIFAGLAIFIACLGLFALAAFATERRIKEIGIRKVLGASVANIVNLLSQDFLKLVLIAIFIASPIAWWVLQNWLSDFAYRINIQWWVFAVSAGLAILITLLTVSAQSIKAALMNPIKSLRTD
ncbi:MAG: ABC transporter permease [Saprospiraceae bacterium]|nr:ABC transporter permease [Saprospiraceae bacterium]